MRKLSEVYNEVSTWASNKRDGRIQTPDLVMTRKDCDVWRMGYYAAMNDVSQHFNMERISADRREEVLRVLAVAAKMPEAVDQGAWEMILLELKKKAPPNAVFFLEQPEDDTNSFILQWRI